MAAIVAARSVLAVRNLDVSTRYYIDMLGFSRDPIDAPGWSFLSKDSFRLMLGECSDAMPAGELGDHSYFVYLTLDDVDDYHREIIARGASVHSGPADKPWGLREFGLTTPDGHRITCGQPVRPATTE